MNLKFFTTALLATGASAAFADEQSDQLTAENLHNKYSQLSEKRQRRVWVRFGTRTGNGDFNTFLGTFGSHGWSCRSQSFPWITQ